VDATFEVALDSAAAGDMLTIAYRVENRGGAEAGPFRISFLLADSNQKSSFDPLISVEVTARAVGPLAPGAAFTEEFTLTLPARSSGMAYLGMRIDPDDAVAELNETNNAGQRRGTDYDSLRVLTPLAETEGNDSLLTAESIPLPSRTEGTIAAGDADFFRISLVEAGRLSTRIDGGSAIRLSLFDAGGNLLVQSNTSIIQHLQGLTDYFLAIEAVNGEASAYTLTSEFDPATEFDPPARRSAASTSRARAALSSLPILMATA
jgi:hypothetical protein